MDKDVCFGVYPAKSFHFDEIEHVINAVEDTSDLQALCLNYMLSYDLDADNNITIDPEKKLIKVKYGTTGFMLIKKEVLEHMVKSYPDLQYYNENTCKAHNIHGDKLFLLFDCIKDPETKDYLSEDFSFSYLWRQLGGEIWADMESKLSHWGNYQFQGNLQAYFNARKFEHR